MHEHNKKWPNYVLTETKQCTYGWHPGCCTNSERAGEKHVYNAFHINISNRQGSQLLSISYEYMTCNELQAISFTHLWVSKQGVLFSSIIKDQFIFRIPWPTWNNIHNWFMIFQKSFWGGITLQNWITDLLHVYSMLHIFLQQFLSVSSKRDFNLWVEVCVLWSPSLLVLFFFPQITCCH